MVTSDEAERIASGWITEYSAEPYVAKVERDRRYFFELDDLVYREPLSALLVLEAAARKLLTNWTYEGLAGGPIRTFFYLYPDDYESEVQAISLRSPAFAELCSLAREGM